MPMHRRHFGETIFDDHPHPVALVHLDGWPWNTSIEAPSGHGTAGHELGFDYLSDEVKFLNAINYLERQLR